MRYQRSQRRVDKQGPAVWNQRERLILEVGQTMDKVSNVSAPQATLLEVMKLLAIIAKRDVTEKALVQELASVGFAPKRIAELVGTTPNTVRVTLSKVRKKSFKRGRLPE